MGSLIFGNFLSPIIRASRTSLVSGSEERHHNRLSRKKVLVLNGWNTLYMRIAGNDFESKSLTIFRSTHRQFDYMQLCFV